MKYRVNFTLTNELNGKAESIKADICVNAHDSEEAISRAKLCILNNYRNSNYRAFYIDNSVYIPLEFGQIKAGFFRYHNFEAEGIK